MDLTNVQSWANFSDIAPVVMDDENNTESHGPYDDVSFMAERFEKAGVLYEQYQQQHAWNNNDLDDSVDSEDSEDPQDPVPYSVSDITEVQDGIYRARRVSGRNVSDDSSAGSGSSQASSEGSSDSSGVSSSADGSAKSSGASAADSGSS